MRGGAHEGRRPPPFRGGLKSEQKEGLGRGNREHWCANVTCADVAQPRGAKHTRSCPMKRLVRFVHSRIALSLARAVAWDMCECSVNVCRTRLNSERPEAKNLRSLDSPCARESSCSGCRLIHPK